MSADSGEHGNETARQAFGETAPPPAPPIPPAPPHRPAATASGPHTPSGQPLSGWWRRAAAFLIDGVIAGAASWVLSFVLGLAIGLVLTETGDDFDPEGDAFVIVSVIVGLIVGFLYAPVLMARSGARNGQTVGKQALGIRVVRMTGEPVSFWNGVLRTVVAQQLLTLVTLYIWALFDYLWPLGDKRNEALHDKIAKTWVVRAAAPAPTSWPPPAPPSAWRAPEAPGSGWLPPQAGA